MQFLTKLIKAQLNVFSALVAVLGNAKGSYFLPNWVPEPQIALKRQLVGLLISPIGPASAIAFCEFIRCSTFVYIGYKPGYFESPNMSIIASRFRWPTIIGEYHVEGCSTRTNDTDDESSSKGAQQHGCTMPQLLEEHHWLDRLGSPLSDMARICQPTFDHLPCWIDVFSRRVVTSGRF